MLANLVGNAVRHAPSGSPVLVTASALAGRVEIRIADHGPGIAADDRERPSSHCRASATGTASGLGLGLARGLTEALDGNLTP